MEVLASDSFCGSVLSVLFYGSDLVWAGLNTVWCVRHTKEIAVLCCDNALLVIEPDASFSGMFYGVMLVYIMLFVIFSVNCNVICNANGSLAITICLIDLELNDILAHL